MQVIKRDGTTVDFDRNKIRIAIEKANASVDEIDRIDASGIEEIIQHIEACRKNRYLVEDIQDMVEAKLMAAGKYPLAKNYVIYRYTRALVRKQNTTDESILRLMRSTNQAYSGHEGGTLVAATLRDYIAGEVSKDLTNRILLPEHITKAHEEGVLHFHDADYFMQPIFNSCIINISDMLDNGTVMNGCLIESPKSFQVACTVLTQIIAGVASNQYGGQSVDIRHLGKYLRRSYFKFKKQIEAICPDESLCEKIARIQLHQELCSGVQTIHYQINTLMTTKGMSPFVTIFMNPQPDHPYAEENAMIIEELLRQRMTGIKNEQGVYVAPGFPKLVYVLNEHNNLTGGQYDNLTRLALQCAAEHTYPLFISAKQMGEIFEGAVFAPLSDNSFLSLYQDLDDNYVSEGRFNQGVVSLNLPQIGILAKGDEQTFWQLLNERLSLCYEALMCRHNALKGIKSDVSPLHWQHGAIARLEKGETIDKLLTGGYSTLSLGYAGLYELTMLVKGCSHTTAVGQDFAQRVLARMNDALQQWSLESKVHFTLCASATEQVCQRFAGLDRARFGRIDGITDQDQYTDCYHVGCTVPMEAGKKLAFESELQRIALGGITRVEIGALREQPEELEKLLHFIYENTLFAELYTQR